ncbi:class I SAM-dependent DNA methyltransferase [uncultured Bacteroides sp.]|uniref:type I restriction-modification system subunit M n=1 Tax=uncultured Bacteroides sp. TaxID=162156 RepID=UPI002633A9F2|nr:class I SAM-dependent DNA methyltransferase [uncultured Bacteroides sp.]
MTEQELANVIWDIKEIIRNLYDDAEVEDVILPFTLLRRLDCVLDEHRDAIMKEMNAIKDKPILMQDIKLKSLLKQHKLTFFNKSGLSLERLLGAPDQIGASFQTYLDGFTDNVKDILANFVHTDTSSETLDLSPIYSRLERHDKLFSVIQLFVQRADLHPNVVSNSMMGTVFEIVVRRSKESSNTKAGQFYTPREIVRLLVSLTMCGKENELYEPGRAFSIYDPCCGTGGMLTAGREYLQEISGRKDLKVYLYGQELNEKTYAICKSDLLMKGEDQNLDRQLFRGDTLGDDKLEGSTFNFMLANPPFGMDWGKDERVKKRVMDDNCLGGRFEAGLPSSNDGSLLFLQHMISKMDNQKGSRIGIVLNGSPLFNGEAGSGWSNIRKMLLDRNLLDCIVALPKNLFYGTDITTYLWILDNKRPAERLNKVLFINAAHTEYTKLLQKNLGKKRFEIAKEDDILGMYREYKDAIRDIVYEKTGKVEQLQVARLLDYDDFRYTTVVTRRPLRLWYENITEKYAELREDENFDADAKKNAILKMVSEIDGIDKKRSDCEFFAYLKTKKIKYTATELKLLRMMFGTISEEAPEVHEKPLDVKSDFVADTNLNDTEKIPQKQDIDEYFAQEVLPYAPEVWMDRTKDKLGVEFPFTRIFYKYRPLRSVDEILAELRSLDDSINI